MISNVELVKMYKNSRCIFDEETCSESTMIVEGKEMITKLIFSHVEANNTIGALENLIETIKHMTKTM